MIKFNFYYSHLFQPMSFYSYIKYMLDRLVNYFGQIDIQFYK